MPDAPSPATDDRPGGLRRLDWLLRESFDHPVAIAGVVVLSMAVAASKFVRVWLIQPALDDVALPRLLEKAGKLPAHDH